MKNKSAAALFLLALLVSFSANAGWGDDPAKDINDNDEFTFVGRSGERVYYKPEHNNERWVQNLENGRTYKGWQVKEMLSRGIILMSSMSKRGVKMVPIAVVAGAAIMGHPDSAQAATVRHDMVRGGSPVTLNIKPVDISTNNGIARIIGETTVPRVSVSEMRKAEKLEGFANRSFRKVAALGVIAGVAAGVPSSATAAAVHANSPGGEEPIENFNVGITSGFESFQSSTSTTSTASRTSR